MNLSMATGKTENDIWPMPKFYFSVNFGTQEEGADFLEIDSLNDSEPQNIGNEKNTISTIKIPGIRKSNAVILKKGFLSIDNVFFKWLEQIQMNIPVRKDITIELLDENKKATMSWKLSNAWPSKIETGEFDSETNEVLIEELEIQYENITVIN